MTPTSDRLPGLLVAAVAILIVVDVVGGTMGILTGVHDTAGEAWGPQASFAAPWPMMVLQVVTAGLAVYKWRRIAIAAAALLAAACIISGVSGFFDGALFASELNAWQRAFQVLLVGWTWVVGLLAAARVVTLVRARGAAARAQAAEPA